MPGLGWAGLLLFISSCIVHGNECLISPSLLALELVPPTLAGLCVLIRGQGRSRRWEAEIQPGRWVLIWILGSEVGVFFQNHTMLLWLNFHPFQTLYTILGMDPQTRHAFISVFHT